MTVGCVLIPRFSLIAAVGDRREMLTEPVALAPEPGGEQAVGEASGAAEAFGIRRRDAALGGARPLPAADPRRPPTRAAPSAAGSARCSGSRGSAPRSSPPGPARRSSPSTACAALGARARRRSSPGRARRSARRPGSAAGRPASAPTRSRRRPRRAGGRPVVVRRGAGTQPPAAAAGLAAARAPAGPTAEAGRLVATLERLGVATLGDLAGLPRVAIADRFGALGLRRTTSPPAPTRRCARDARTRSSSRRSACPRPPTAPSSSGPSSC